MIDIHCHILPELDDGAGSLEESVGMARAAAADGIAFIVATPHHANGRWTNEAAVVLERVETLNAVLVQEGVPLTVVPGQEIRVYRDLLDDYNEGKLLTLGHSPYMLLEFSSGRVPDQIEDLIHELLLLGITPVIAHPERNQELSGNPERLAQLIRQGALSQLTSHSVTGLFGRKLQELSLSWCRMNLTHFISTDAHDLTDRPFNLQAAYHMIDEKLGGDYMAYYRSNAERLLRGEEIEPWELRMAKRKWYKFWG